MKDSNNLPSLRDLRNAKNEDLPALTEQEQTDIENAIENSVNTVPLNLIIKSAFETVSEAMKTGNINFKDVIKKTMLRTAQRQKAAQIALEQATEDTKPKAIENE